MAQIQKRTLAGLDLVARHDPGFHLDRPAHGMAARRVIAGQSDRVFFKPVKERRVAQQPVFTTSRTRPESRAQ